MADKKSRTGAVRVKLLLIQLGEGGTDRGKCSLRLLDVSHSGFHGTEPSAASIENCRDENAVIALDSIGMQNLERSFTHHRSVDGANAEQRIKKRSCFADDLVGSAELRPLAFVQQFQQRADPSCGTGAQLLTPAQDTGMGTLLQQMPRTAKIFVHGNVPFVK